MTPDVRQEIVALLPRLRRFACALTGSLDAADDVVQSACEKALTRLDQFTPGTRCDLWMFQIIRTVWIDKVRYARRRETVNDPEEVERVGFDARIHEGTEAKMDLAIVRKEIASLSEEQRVVLVLVTVDGRSYQETADMLGIPIGTVMSRLARARRRLADAVNSELRRGDTIPRAVGDVT
ncbi:MAG: RNA polymerase subunit sigma-70 [Hyphomicrobium sp.]|nr:RNA polymerase subunit sigma-70 [Hyphomicrobium sp.]